VCFLELGTQRNDDFFVNFCRLEDIQESADVFKQFLSENHANSIPLNTTTIQALLWVIIEIEIA